MGVGREKGAGAAVGAAGAAAGWLSVATVSGTVGGGSAAVAGGEATPESGGEVGVGRGEAEALTPGCTGTGCAELLDTVISAVTSTAIPMTPKQPAAAAAMLRWYHGVGPVSGRSGKAARDSRRSVSSWSANTPPEVPLCGMAPDHRCPTTPHPASSVNLR